MIESLITAKVDVGGVGGLESTVHFLVRADRPIDLSLVLISNKGQILVLIVVFFYFRHFAVFPFDIRS